MKIAMLISGGVDSSVALRLLKEQGHDITAFYLKIWLEDEMSFLGECPWEDDLSYVKQVCRDADVPLEVVPFQKEYWERIVSYTIDEVKKGHTPNPDVLCNTRVKFGAFYEYLLSRPDGASFDRIASGHYAQVEMIDGIAYLKRSPDVLKDQTYFLSQLTQAQVARALFPIGHLQKFEVRALAEKYNLPNAKRKDSQGLCFLGKIRFDEFVKFHLGVRKGDMIDFETKKKMGEHEGFWYYTIGQRKNIKLSGGPWYVIGKDIEKNIVYISNSYRSERTARNTFTVGGLNWAVPAVALTKESGELMVKVRHGEKMYPCDIEWIDEDRIKVTIDGYDTGLASGQFAVFYDGQYCLGGGVIE
ncbi:MAG: tRNA 2-thiouridine(34) synthase MnmA [Candidatus Latescibacterota bacterium]|jgi:tRNA-specific 2-thiouridylase